MLTDEEITTVGNQAWHDTLSGGLLNWERVEATSLAVAAAVRAETRKAVLEECRVHLLKRHGGACAFFDADMECPDVVE